ncbi:MAG: aminotransferase class V-fold PLP-dependent enzyme [Acidimicrobiia bacterium]|nr:aminotransferase class V-fold PLP-dependent enzyme [Acidimicrobiia bacterium]
MDNLLRLRHEFPSLDHSVHMISHSLGAMPRLARDRLLQFADQWSARSIRAWEEGWWEMPRSVGNLIARIIGAAEGEVVMQPNVSIAQAIVLSCFDWSAPRNHILSEQENFPTNLYLFHALQSDGAKLITVPHEQLLHSIDERTRLVCLSHVLFKSSYIQDVAAITSRAHQMGAMVVADIYQSAGSVPVDVRSWNLDFATGGSVKWLCGGPGAGYLYVRRDLWQSLEPKLTGWMAHRAPFQFDPGPIDYSPDAFRFLHGTPSIPALYAAQSGYELILEAGVDHIRAKSLRQTRLLIDLALERGFRINSPTDDRTRGGVVILDIPEGARITQQLLARDILLDHRPNAGIRIAPHFYTTDDECRLTIEEIAKLAV